MFRIGNATHHISWKSYRDVADDPSVAWTIPLSLGDSHRGYRVLGKPFRVVGILKRTGTPVERTLHVGLEAIEAMHLD